MKGTPAGWRGIRTQEQEPAPGNGSQKTPNHRKHISRPQLRKDDTSRTTRTLNAQRDFPARPQHSPNLQPPPQDGSTRHPPDWWFPLHLQQTRCVCVVSTSSAARCAAQALTRSTTWRIIAGSMIRLALPSRSKQERCPSWKAQCGNLRCQCQPCRSSLHHGDNFGCV